MASIITILLLPEGVSRSPLQHRLIPVRTHLISAAKDEVNLAANTDRKPAKINVTWRGETREVAVRKC
jgi:hypothetical protein